MPKKTATVTDDKSTDMRRSWLVQRLCKPFVTAHPILGKDNPFAFGGGLRNGGLSGDAMDLLREVFRFDYMGAAEFEWGAVPEALSGLAKDEKRLTAFSFTIPLAKVAADWREREKPAPEGDGTVYVLCRREHRAEVERRIRAWAKLGYKADLKETPNLSNTLRPVHEWDGDRVGWLELDNGFLFFTDRVMWEATCLLFGCAVPQESAA